MRVIQSLIAMKSELLFFYSILWVSTLNVTTRLAYRMTETGIIYRIMRALNQVFRDTTDRTLWHMLLLGSLLDICSLPPLELRLGELLRDSTALELPELDEWTASVALCKLFHSGLELAHKVPVAMRMAFASKEPSLKP